MRRIVKLKGEIVIAAFISIVLGWGLSCIILNIIKVDRFTYNGYGQAYNINYDKVNVINQSIDKMDKDNVDSKIREFIDKCSNGEDIYYLTDKDGNVIYSNDNQSVVKIIDVSDDERKISMMNDGKQYTTRDVFKLPNDQRLVFIRHGYYSDDSRTLIFMIFCIIVIFILLLCGRVKYINKLSSVVNQIKDGELSVRAKVKYKNELTSLANGINTMAEEIEKQDLREKEFITNISHDLRTPLTTIMGYVDMIKEERYESKEELDKYIGIIDRKSKYLKSMLEDFFYYSKVRSDDIKKENLRINLNETLYQILDGEEEHFTKKNLKLNINICKENIYINGDPMLIFRCFQNLISNALKYSKEDTDVDISFCSRLDGDKKYGVFNISNIPCDKLEKTDVSKLFDRMYKADKSRNKKGSGLGLAITKEIVKNYGGLTSAYLALGRINFEVCFLVECLREK